MLSDSISSAFCSCSAGSLFDNGCGFGRFGGFFLCGLSGSFDGGRFSDGLCGLSGSFDGRKIVYLRCFREVVNSFHSHYSLGK